MCGILGFYNFSARSLKSNIGILNILFEESHSRGKEASGLAIADNDYSVHFIKSDLDGRKLIKTAEFEKMMNSLASTNVRSAIGHTRIATHGLQLNNNNNQPVVSDDNRIVLVHNGIIVNATELWESFSNNAFIPELDTIILSEYYRHLSHSYSKPIALAKLFHNIKGSASLAIIDSFDNSFILSSNIGSLYYVYDTKGERLFFASEKIFFYNILKKISCERKDIVHIKPLTALIIENNQLKSIDLRIATDILPQKPSNKPIETPNSKIIDYSTAELKSEAAKLYTIENDINLLRNHDFDYDKIYKIQRCTKCILPATTPFIKFDDNGVCNYCNEHKPITHKGFDALLKIADKYRKTNGEPDCLAAFSGGKDSAYGLHFLKKELGLHPLAYSYDWGMITDIGRRNQARILEKLQIEHIVISANITMKRMHIRQNILAWLKDPHPGVVTLFMQGDKQCEFYADRIKGKYNLDLMFFFRGNELEIDEFKTGHCGVKDADPGGVIHHLAPFKKAKLLSFFASRYFKNLSLFNSSFLETSKAFYSTYLQPHNYVYLWHFIPWEEQKILDTLIKEFQFELSPETVQTWRTDDGSSAFYNYIYYTVQGFTENDSFRSRQIREGLMDRQTALNLVNQENKPRYGALKWYFDVLGLDGDYVLGVIDKKVKRQY
jgi:glutamine---fructose-6-phosphate transaminase (isomerizing)